MDISITSYPMRTKFSPHVHNTYMEGTVSQNFDIWECIWEKGPIGNFTGHENKFDCRETTLSHAANHLKIFLIEFEICLYKHLYFLYIRNPLFPIVVFISMLWQLKVHMFYPKNSFPIV